MTIENFVMETINLKTGLRPKLFTGEQLLRGHLCEALCFK